MKYYIETYGCQMNFAESSALENTFKSHGFTKAEEPIDSDIVIINTCSVRKSAEERVWGRLGYIKAAKQKKKLKVILTGCMAQHYGSEIREKDPTIDVVIGNFNKDSMVEIIKSLNEDKDQIDLVDSKVFKFDSNHQDGDSFKAFVPIMHGCNNFCTYCIVPHVRGREVSRPVAEILTEINTLVDNGVVEVTLLGQNVNSYTSDDLTFPELLQVICDKTKVQWIRFVSSHPKDLSDDLIEVMKNNERICNHLHLPVQHGSDRILKEMNRKYTRNHYLDIVNKLKKAIPDVSLTTDILIGFPGETEEDIDDTILLVEEAKYEAAFTYYYNPREGTKAATMENQLSDEIKKERLARVIDIQRSISLDIKKARIGNVVEVLAESVSKKNDDEILGRSKQNNMVVFEADNDIIGSIVKVRILKIVGNTLCGELV